MAVTPSLNSAHSRDTQFASREYSTSASGYARNRRNAGTLVAKSGSSHGSAINVSTAGVTPITSQSAYAPPAMTSARGPGAPVELNTPPLLQQPPAASAQQPTQPPQQAAPEPTQPAPATPQVEISAQAASPQPVAQTAAPSAPLLKSDGPKTRAQVRAEIARAREDGSMPPFGNPDPAGPGGAPSLTMAPRP